MGAQVLAGAHSRDAEGFLCHTERGSVQDLYIYQGAAGKGGRENERSLGAAEIPVDEIIKVNFQHVQSNIALLRPPPSVG